MLTNNVDRIDSHSSQWSTTRCTCSCVCYLCFQNFLQLSHHPLVILKNRMIWRKLYSLNLDTKIWYVPFNLIFSVDFIFQIARSHCQLENDWQCCWSQNLTYFTFTRQFGIVNYIFYYINAFSCNALIRITWNLSKV